MVLFFVGIIEMVISAAWTKAVAKSNTAMTGVITTINIFIWFYVIQVVVDNLDNWSAIVPYAIGCAIGAMLGASGLQQKVVKAWKRQRRARSLASNRASALAISMNRPARSPGQITYDAIR